MAFDLRAEVFLLLAPAAAPAGPKRPKQDRAKKKPAGPADASGKKPGKKPKEEDPALEDDSAARDTYDGDKIVLDPFVREFLLLELPMVPLREDLRSEGPPAIERPPEPALGEPIDARGNRSPPRAAGGHREPPPRQEGVRRGSSQATQDQ